MLILLIVSFIIMINKYILTATLLVAAIIFAAIQIHDSHHLTINSDFSVKYQSISSILRTNLSAINTLNDTIFVGDSVGSVSIWNFNSKKASIQYEDISRPTSGYLPPPNNVIQVEATDSAGIALTADGHLTTYALNSAKKIIGNTKWDLTDSLKKFSLISSDKGIYLAGITVTQKQLCIYKLGESLVKPNPISKIVCNQTTANHTYEDISYDKNNSLIATGNKAAAYIFSFNTTDEKTPLAYLCQANMPAAEQPGYKNVFTLNGTLIAANDLWLTSIFIDLTLPSAKVISAQRTERYVKSGETDAISVNKVVGSREKTFTVLVNAKNKMSTYQLQTSNKLSYVNDSKTIGKSKNFVLRDSSRFFATQSNELIDAIYTNDTENGGQIKVQASYTIVSSNHFQAVQVIGIYNDIMVTASQGGKNNIKVWKINNYNMTMIDDKSVSFFSLLKSGYMNFDCLVFLPPPSKENANATLHFAVAGADPFEVVIVALSADNKIKSVSKSKDSHFQTITGLFLSPNKKILVSTSMDTLMFTWTFQEDRDNLTKSEVTTTKMGPIANSVQDKSGLFYVLGHDSTLNDKKSNISIWQLDEKKGKLTKVCQNVAGQAHEDNMTNLILSKDEKYIISLSDKGQIRLWRHENWTMVDLLASLATGIKENIEISMSSTNRLIVETVNDFSEYIFDFNGFILTGKASKSFPTKPTGSFVSGNRILSGDQDGSIRAYSFTDGQ